MKNNIFKVIICFLIFFYGKYLQYIPICLFKLNKPSPTTDALLIMFSSFIECLLLFLLFRKELKEDFSKFKNNFMINFDIGIRYWFIGLFGMIASNILIGIFFKVNGSTNEALIREMTALAPYAMFIDSTFLAPFIEEITFRFNFKLLIKNKLFYILSSGIIFGFLHIIFSFSSLTEFLYIIPYSCMGICYALICLKTDTVSTPIFIHMLHNGFTMLLAI